MDKLFVAPSLPHTRPLSLSMVHRGGLGQASRREVATPHAPAAAKLEAFIGTVLPCKRRASGRLPGRVAAAAGAVGTTIAWRHGLERSCGRDGRQHARVAAARCPALRQAQGWTARAAADGDMGACEEWSSSAADDAAALLRRAQQLRADAAALEAAQAQARALSEATERAETEPAAEDGAKCAADSHADRAAEHTGRGAEYGAERVDSGVRTRRQELDEDRVDSVAELVLAGEEVSVAVRAASAASFLLPLLITACLGVPPASEDPSTR